MKNSKAIWTVKTECGPIREKNEDAIYPDKSGSSSLPIKAGIFDGMGGHKKGEVASLIASEVMDDSFINITDYVNLANKNILDYQNKHSEATGMGTTSGFLSREPRRKNPSPAPRATSWLQSKQSSRRRQIYAVVEQ